MSTMRGGGVVTDAMAEEEVEGLQLMMVRRRDLGYPVFDADNHLYETTEALVKFLPREYRGLIRYIDVDMNGDGRIKQRLAINDRIAGIIPNPTFSRVAPPGGQSNDPKQRRSIAPSTAFFDPDSRLRLMEEFGIDKALLFPTLAGTVEPYLSDAVPAIPVFVHAFNQWLREHWSFNYQDRIYSAPIISLAILPDAISELEYVLDQGAKAIWVAPTPSTGLTGVRSFALPEFDPFWKVVEEADVLVAMHQTLWRIERPSDAWNGTAAASTRSVFENAASPAFELLAAPEPALADALASLIGHGLATRFPMLRFAPVEFRMDPLADFVLRLQRAYEDAPLLFDEDPYEVLRRNVFIHCFQDTNPRQTIDLMGVDHVMFGSDFPHVEGMNDPLAYADRLAHLSPEDQAKVMGGNIARIMKVDAAVSH
jgi:predicted TIM-barrel fold metal-dependent hydrolase